MSQYNQKQHAAALRYSTDSGRAPVVVASGAGYTAQKIIEIAQQSNVPVYQDDALASLLSQLDAGTEIPPELYQAVADLYLYFLKYGEKLPEDSEAALAAGTAQNISLPEFSESTEDK